MATVVREWVSGLTAGGRLNDGKQADRHPSDPVCLRCSKTKAFTVCKQLWILSGRGAVCDRRVGCGSRPADPVGNVHSQSKKFLSLGVIATGIGVLLLIAHRQGVLFRCCARLRYRLKKGWGWYHLSGMHYLRVMTSVGGVLNPKMPSLKVYEQLAKRYKTLSLWCYLAGDSHCIAHAPLRIIWMQRVTQASKPQSWTEPLRNFVGCWLELWTPGHALIITQLIGSLKFWGGQDVYHLANADDLGQVPKHPGCEQSKVSTRFTTHWMGIHTVYDGLCLRLADSNGIELRRWLPQPKRLCVCF